MIEKMGNQRIHLASAVTGILAICYVAGCGLPSILILIASLSLGSGFAYWLVEISNGDTFDVFKGLILEKCGVTIKTKKKTSTNFVESNEKTRRMPWEGIKVAASLNESLETLLNEIVEQYVNGWYGETISRDRAFLNEIRYQLRFACASLMRIIERIDLAKFLTEKAIPTAILHAKRLTEIEQKMREAETNRNLEMPRSMIETKIAKSLTDCHVTMSGREQEAEYVKQIGDYLIGRLLDETRLAGRAHDDDDSQMKMFAGRMGGKKERAWPSKSIRCLLREIMTNAILLPTLDVLTKPDTINYWLILIFDENRVAHINDPIDKTPVQFLKGLTTDTIVDNFPDSLLQLKLSEILRDARLYAIFRMYLQDIRGPVHELQFLTETTRIHESIQRKLESASQIAYDIWQLYGQFVHESAPEKVDFDEELFLKYHEAVESKDLEILEGIIEESYQVVYNRMQSDHVIVFCQSECFLGHLCGSPPITINELIDRDAQEKRRNVAVEKTFSLSQLRDRVRKKFTSISDEDDEQIQPESQTSDTFVKVVPLIGVDNEDDEAIVETVEAPVEPSQAKLIIDADARDLNTWKVNVSRVAPLKDAYTNRTIYVFVIDIERPDAKPHETKYWSIHRSFNEFYVLESKLNEFHGDSLRFAALPPRKTFVTKDRPFMEQHRLIFSTFLSTLSKQKILNRSDLLLAFLSSNDEFRDTLMLSDLNPWNVVKKMPAKLSREKGQNLRPYLLKTLATTLATTTTTPTSSLTSSNEEEHRTRSVDSPANCGEQVTATLAMSAVYSSIYGNNFGGIVDAEKARTAVMMESTIGLWTRSIFDAALFLIWGTLKLGANYILHILAAVRIFCKNTIDSICQLMMASTLEKCLSTENLVYLIQHIQYVLFCNDQPMPTEQEMMMREELAKRRTLEFVQKAKNFWVDTAIGEENVRIVMSKLLEAIQYPRMNKQLLYVLIDQLLVEVFEELDEVGNHPLLQ